MKFFFYYFSTVKKYNHRDSHIQSHGGQLLSFKNPCRDLIHSSSFKNMFHIFVIINFMILVLVAYGLVKLEKLFTVLFIA